MNHFNITNIHDNGKSQIVVGLDSKKFTIKNSGNTISIEDTANGVSKLKVGGAAGFTISLSGGKISFTANSGGPLVVSEPGRGGIPDCPFFYSHQDKYGGSTRTASTMTLKTASISNEDSIADETKLPNPRELEDGTIMMVINGHWVEYSFDDLYDMIMDKMNSQYTLHKI